MEERLDIFTEDFRYLGVATRQEAHRNGYWHQTFHCWVAHQTVNGCYVLLQKRHASKDTNPLKYDTSCAGHLEAGESPEDGLRELQEELGLTTNFQSLYHAGVFKYDGEDPAKKVIDREFCHVFVHVRQADTLNDYEPALGEVSGLYLIPIEAMKQVCRGLKQRVVIKGYAIEDDGTKHEQILEIGLEDFVKNERAYYELLFASLDQINKGN